MTVGELESLLRNICDDGYGDWIVYMCDDDDEDYSINHIYIDSDGDICMESTDAEDETHDFSCGEILNRLRKYSDDTYVYFIEVYEDESSNSYDIDDEWYIGTDYGGDDILNIDCFHMEEW